MKTITCGANTRAGSPCKRSPMTGKRRCRNHGGLSSGARNPARPGNQNARKHGIYSTRLTDEERALLPMVKVGSLDDEIIVMRILLARALAEERDVLATDENALEATQIRRKPGYVETVRRRKVERLEASIDRLLARIGSLVSTRAKLQSTELAMQIADADARRHDEMAALDVVVVHATRPGET